MAVCRPAVEHDSRRLSAAGAPASALAELDILVPDDAPPADSHRDAGLYRDISVEREGKGSVLRLPLYGYRGGAGADELCEREVAPLLRRLLDGESCAVIAYGQTGAAALGAGVAFVGRTCTPRHADEGLQSAGLTYGYCATFFVQFTPLLPHIAMQALARATPWAPRSTAMGRRPSRTRVRRSRRGGSSLRAAEAA